ncbi:unnamed protein product [Heterobilharzia americana]|nr:unnamed protein product [Heterobilharzia americana]
MRQGTFVHGEPIYVNFVVKSNKKASMKSAKQQFSAVCDMEINNNLTPYKDKSSGNHPIPMSTDSPDPEFTIDKRPGVEDESSFDLTRKKKLNTATVQCKASDPKLNKKHQLKIKV